MAAKKIREYESKRLLKEHLKRLSDIDLQICSAQVMALIDFTDLVNNEPWLSLMKSVVKPDMLFDKRGKSGLVSLNLDLEHMAQFVKKHLDVEVEMDGCNADLNFHSLSSLCRMSRSIICRFVSDRLDSTINFSECGWIEIEENWDKVKKVFLPTEKPMTSEVCVTLIATLPLELIPLHLPPDDTSTERMVQIDGTTEQIEAAKQLVNDVVNSAYTNE